jgi:hypothetical protein
MAGLPSRRTMVVRAFRHTIALDTHMCKCPAQSRPSQMSIVARITANEELNVIELED